MLREPGRGGRGGGLERAAGKVGAETRVKGSPPRVPTKGSSAASIPIGSPATGISLIPLRFGGIHHPRRTCPPSRAPEFRTSASLPRFPGAELAAGKFFIRTLASFTSEVSPRSSHPVVPLRSLGEAASLCVPMICSRSRFSPEMGSNF